MFWSETDLPNILPNIVQHSEAAFRLGQNRKTCPFFDQNIVNNDDVIYGHCVDGQKFYVVKKGQKSDKFSVFWPSLNAAWRNNK